MNDVTMLAVSVGNSRIRIGAFVRGELVHTATLENSAAAQATQVIEEAMQPLRSQEDAGLMLASVNPEVADRLSPQLVKVIGREPLRLERAGGGGGGGDRVTIPVGRHLDREAMVGEDRLLNAAAAYDVLQQAAIVVDAGTAVTVDFIDGVGTFHGGAIAPGAQLMMDALNRRTAQLPESEFRPPVETLGHNTVEAMRAGVYHAIRGLVREMVEAIAEHAGAFPMVVATGGDANALFRDHDLIDRLVPDLTLMGMAVTMRAARERA